nr:beta-xylanase [Aquisalinus luteolus]
MTFGTAMDTNTSGDANYRALVTEHCNNLVAEYSHKWESIRPTPDIFNFGDGDRLTDFAASENIEIRFHTLLWEDQERYPDWFDTYDFGADPAREAERLLTDHIQTVARRYGGQITSWDVVNEAVDPGTGAYRSSPFSRTLGSMETVLDIAFNTARAELPNAQLVYNDFMSWGNGVNHRDGVLRLLEGMVARGTPIDALGVQSHVWGGNASGFGADETAWRTFLDEVTGMGLDLVITEFDINDAQLPANIATRDERVAEVTTAYLDLMFDYPQVRDCVVWGLVHQYSWLQSFAPRSDGLANRPTPFDDNYDPTPMAEAILASFEATSVRT